MSARAVLPAAVTIAVIVAVAWVLAGRDDPPGTTAEFRDANGLREGSLVKVGGVAVGRVDRLRITARDTARATFALDTDAPTVRADARATIRSANLLGEKYVDLTPGHSDRALPPTGIPRSRTGTPIELDDLLGVLDDPTRVRVAILLQEAGTALGGRGDDLARGLAVLPRTLTDLEALADEATASTRELSALVVRSDRVLERVAERRHDVGRLVDATSRALAAPAARAPRLRAALREAPSTLVSLRRTLLELDRAGAALRPAATGLRAIAPQVTSTARALPGFTAAARPAFRELQATAPDLGRLGRSGARVSTRLRSGAASLAALTRESRPLADLIGRSGSDVLAFLEAWARTTQQRDAVGHMFRIAPALTPQATDLLETYVEDGLDLVAPPARRPAPARAPASRPAPAERPPTPPAAAGAPRPAPRPPLDVLGRLDDLAAPLLPDRPAADGSAGALLDFLLRP